MTEDAGPDPQLGAEDRPDRELIAELEPRLLAIGGTRVHWDRPPIRRLQDIVTRGRLFDAPVSTRRGWLRRCHSNAAALWGLWMGEALTEPGGAWIAHSWLVQPAPRGEKLEIIETTFRMARDFG